LQSSCKVAGRLLISWRACKISDSHGKGLSGVKITSPKLGKLNNPNLSLNEKALLCCQTALELRDKGDYEGAQEVMRPFWKRLGERPQIEGLQKSAAIEVLLCVGILTDWIGSTRETKYQETAKNLISEAITFYEAIGDFKRVAEARADLAYCYWREGGLDEARIMLTEALERLTTEGNTRARAILIVSLRWYMTASLPLNGATITLKEQ
jgi:tetratricopeptide (TPR) repeat protein